MLLLASLVNELNIFGNDEFIKATTKVIASNKLFANMILANSEDQEILESKRLDIEIEQVVDLDFANI